MVGKERMSPIIQSPLAFADGPWDTLSVPTTVVLLA